MLYSDTSRLQDKESDDQIIKSFPIKDLMDQSAGEK